ncbi:MAG: hypothetical protein ACRD2U_01375 [Terriglobales bacterium]
MASLLDTRRAFLAAVTIGLFALAARNVTDPDVWWHLRTGQLILQNHAVFRADPYSFTKFGQPWINHEWLSDILIFSIYRAAGWTGLIASFAAVTTGTFMLVFARCDGGPYLASAFAVWAAIASVPFWGVRPQTFSLFFASLFLVLMERSYSRPILLWYTPPLMLIWVNLHAGYGIGIAFLALFLLGDLVNIAVGAAEWKQSRDRLKRLGLALALCLALVPLNPYGRQMYWYPLQTAHSRSIQAYIAEWLSPNFHQGMYVASLLLMLAIFAGAAVSPRRLSSTDLLLLATTMWAALHSARLIPIYAIVAAPILSRLVFACVRESGRFSESAPTTVQWPGRQILNGTVLAAFLLFGFLKIHAVVKNQAEVEKSAFPFSAVSFLRTNRLPKSLFNDYNWGGYLIWQLYPEYRVCIDGRADLYGDTFMDRFATVYHISGASWHSTLNDWGAETVLVPPDAPIVGALRLLPEWRKVYGDAQAVIFLKAEAPPNQ